MRPCVVKIFIWHLISCMVAIMPGMHGVGDRVNSFLKLVDVFDAGNNELTFKHYPMICSLHVHYILSLAFCQENMTT